MLHRPIARPVRFVVAVAAAVAFAGPASAQLWTEVGPTFVTGGQNTSISPSRITGAVRGIAVQPNNPNVIYAATVNGGIWKTTNGTAASPTWTPLTDALPSLVASDIQFDPTDATYQTLVYTAGRFSSYFEFGGPQAGVYRSTNGGASWTAINGSGTSMT